LAVLPAGLANAAKAAGDWVDEWTCGPRRDGSAWTKDMSQHQPRAIEVGQRVVFLDRDGTINLDHGYVHRFEDWEFLPGAVEAIRQLRGAGYQIAVVSNQSGIGSGQFTRDDVERLHGHVARLLASEGADVDAWAFCPHTSADECPCRKPRTGMVGAILRHLNAPIDFGASWMVGDKPGDVEFGGALGMRSILLTSRYWDAVDHLHRPDQTAASLAEAARIILGKDSY
jgi:D-glycero-D-manno-heptose 1,7-bisphosphate phosphatase